jgi:hypothetical protein
MGSLFTIGLIVAILVIAAAGLYLYTRSNSENPLFAPRERRLAYVERAHLDGGRKLVLIRRDDVEHLLLVGGPIDLVIETGIPAEPRPGREAPGATGDVFGAVQSYADSARTWQRGFGLAGGRSGGAEQPGLSLAGDGKGGEPNGEDTLELTTAHEAKR